MGILVMAGDLIIAGLFQGFWAAMYPWQASIDVSTHSGLSRTGAGLPMFGGVLVFVVTSCRLT